MSHPIKIVEDSKQSPTKIIDICQPKQINQNQNLPNYSFFQFNQINNSIYSPNIKEFLDFAPLPNNKYFNNENFSLLNENNKIDNNSLIKLNSTIFQIDTKNQINNINREEKIELKNANNQIPGVFTSYNNCHNENKSFNDMNIENMYKEKIIGNNINFNIKNDSLNSNNCLNKNIKNNEIKEYLNKLKIYTKKIVNSLGLIYSKYEYLLSPSNNIESINSKIDIEKNKNFKNEEKENSIINNNLINKKNANKDNTNTKEDNNILSPKLNSNLFEKEKNIKPLLNINKPKNIFKPKNHDIKEENNLNNNNIKHPKVKTLKRIGNRKFNVKTRGLRYNILTEEKKKQLLLDAMNMRTVEVAKKYGISTRNVNRWKKKGIQRKKGSGRKFKDPRLERKILEWYKMQDKETLTSRQFKEKAIELSDNKTFRASSGWLTNMKRKYNINFKKY